MKIKVEIIEDIDEPCFVIKTPSLNDQVKKIVEYVKTVDSKTSDFVIGYDSQKEKTIILKPEDITKVSVDDRKTYIYVKNERYLSKKRLYELEDILGDAFFRISKNTLVNIDSMDNIEASFGGVFLLTLKNGFKEYVSKKYISELKRFLGI